MLSNLILLDPMSLLMSEQRNVYNLVPKSRLHSKAFNILRMVNNAYIKHCFFKILAPQC